MGNTLEFTRPWQFKPFKGMIGGGPFGLEASQSKDDTGLAARP